MLMTSAWQVQVRIEALGPARGLFTKPEKSQFVHALGVSEEAARAATSPLEFIHMEGVRHIRVYMGYNNYK